MPGRGKVQDHPTVVRHNDEVLKLTYFLQGVTASAIAFALHETSDRKADVSLVVIGLALVTWAVGFGAGVIHSHAVQRAMRAGIVLDESDAGRATDQQRSKANALWKSSNRQARAAYQVLSWGLLVGALLYGTGHALHILRQDSQLPTATSKVAQKTVAPNAAARALER